MIEDADARRGFLSMLESEENLSSRFSMADARSVFVDDARARRGSEDDPTPGLRPVVPAVAADLASRLEGTEDGDEARRILALAGRAALCAVELGLPIPTSTLFRTIAAVSPWIRTEPRSHGDLLHVARALGRQRMDPADPKVWEDLLRFPHPGVRTVAAQNVVRRDPAAAADRLVEFEAAGCNMGLVAHELDRARAAAAAGV